MDETTFKARLAELVRKINELPESEQERLRPLIAETEERHHALKENCDTIRDGLDSIRLNMKYIVFDRDATRRERDALAHALQTRRGDDYGGNDRDRDRDADGDDNDLIGGSPDA